MVVEVRVAGLALDESGQHVLLLKPVEEPADVQRMIPIWIGGLEATSIMVALQGSPVPRPLAHDLMRSLLDSAGATVDSVAITRIEDGTYYAEITLTTPLGVRRVDARPSDAVALATRAGTRIWVAEAVLEEAGVPDLTVEEDDADAADGASGSVSGAGVDDEEQRVDEFKRFLNEVDPEDFRG